MGKTSILRFLEQRVPTHVLAVYVNLEKTWAEKGLPNLWGYLIDQTVDAAGLREYHGRNHLDRLCTTAEFVRVVDDICQKLAKNYVLLLLDEFRTIIERSSNPGAILSEFRDFHDNPRNRISLLIADRLTRAELEKTCPHELWVQLTSKPIGPLDRNAIDLALSTPAIGTEESDVVFLADTVDRLHNLTSGYPYHVVRAAQGIIESKLYDGPWLVALPEDVDDIFESMVTQDELFRAGLCRPDRLDSTLEDAIAAILEWGDFSRVLAGLRREREWAGTFDNYCPKMQEFLTGLGFPDALLERLMAVGVVRMTGPDYIVFSPLLERWLRGMRDQGRRLAAGTPTREWAVGAFRDGAALAGDKWQSLDAQLAKQFRDAGKTAPLKPRISSDIDEWRGTFDRRVSSRDSFKDFLDGVFCLIIDDRENRDAMRAFPRFAFAYHTVRLVRNYWTHEAKTQAAMEAWNQLCARVLRKHDVPEPVSADEWAALRTELVRSLFNGYRSALAAVLGS